MTVSVQDAVDALADRLGRPVGVDDRHYSTVAYSSHHDEIDPVRRMSILGRRAPPAVIAWLDTLGLTRTQAYVRVPARPDLQMVARICFPLRLHRHVLGFLWLADHQAPITERELSVAADSVPELSELLFIRAREHDEARGSEAATVRMMVNGDTSQRSGLANAPAYGFIVLKVLRGHNALAGREVEVRIAAALDQARRLVASGEQLASIEPAGANVLLACSDPDTVAQRATVLLSMAQGELADVPEAAVVAGVATFSKFDGVVNAHRQAQLAAWVAGAVGDCAAPLHAEQLGPYGLIADLLGERQPSDLFPAPLRRLMADSDASQLLTTLVAYLEHAGDATATSSALFLHRSSLYNRLRRIQEISGSDLRCGADRLELHLGLALWRLAGHRESDEPFSLIQPGRRTPGTQPTPPAPS